MKMHRSLHYLTLVLLFFFLSSSIYSQNIIKNIYLFDDFEDGTIVTGSGNEVTSKINYHTLEEKIYLLKKGFKLALDENMTVDSVKIGSRLFLPINNAFYEVLVNGKTQQLLRQHRSKLSEKSVSVGYNQNNKTTPSNTIRFTESSFGSDDGEIPLGYDLVFASSYWVKNNNELKEFNSAKQLIKIFPKKKVAIKNFAKENKTDFTKNENVISMFKYVNSVPQ